QLMPEGSFRFQAVSATSDVSPSGVATYKLPASGLLKFSAVQKARPPLKVTAKTAEEATEKLGLKGTVGVEIKVVKLEGEVSKEDEKKKSQELSFEWEVTAGAPSF